MTVVTCDFRKKVGKRAHPIPYTQSGHNQYRIHRSVIDIVTNERYTYNHLKV